jgi:hypothetical protein
MNKKKEQKKMKKKMKNLNKCKNLHKKKGYIVPKIKFDKIIMNFKNL